MISLKDLDLKISTQTNLMTLNLKIRVRKSKKLVKTLKQEPKMNQKLDPVPQSEVNEVQEKNDAQSEVQIEVQVM